MQLQEQLPRDVRLIALNVDSDAQPSAALAEQVASTFHRLGIECESIICTDATEGILRELGISSLPAAVVIDDHGVIRYRWSGEFDLSSELPPILVTPK